MQRLRDGERCPYCCQTYRDAVVAPEPAFQLAGGYTYDWRLTRDGVEVPLRPREVDLLEALLAARGQPVPYRRLLQQLYDGAATLEAVRILTSSLHRKAPDIIERPKFTGWRASRGPRVVLA